MPKKVINQALCCTWRNIFFSFECPMIRFCFLKRNSRAILSFPPGMMNFAYFYKVFRVFKCTAAVKMSLLWRNIKRLGRPACKRGVEINNFFDKLR